MRRAYSGGSASFPLVSIAVTPSNPALIIGATSQLTATGTYSDLSTKNITSSVTWSSGSAAATVTTGSAGGFLTAVDAGSPLITATLGAISGTTTPVITDDGTFNFNLDTINLAPGLTGNRTGGAMYVARANGTVPVQLATTDPVYESSDTGHGQWTFPAYTNRVADPFSFASGANWTHFNSPVLTTGQLDPLGGTTATKIRDNSGASVATVVSQTASTGYDPCASVWVRDDPTDPPTGTGIVAGLDTTGNGTGAVAFCSFLTSQDLSSGQTWKRRHSKFASSGTAYKTYATISPAGQTPTTGAATQTPAATGSRIFWGAQATSGAAANAASVDFPLVNGSTSARVLAPVAVKLGDVLSAGALDIEGSCYFADIQSSQALAGLRVCSIQATPGLTYLEFVNTIFTVQWAGFGVAGITTSYPRPGQLVQWRIYYLPAITQVGAVIKFNGCIVGQNVQGAALGANGTPTAMFLGADETGTTKILPAMHTLWKRSDRPSTTLLDSEAAMLGDSILASYLGTYYTVGSLIYKDNEASTRRGINSLAVTGHTIANQSTVWTASAARGNVNTKWVSVQLGINDILTGRTSAQIIADLQTLITDINTSTPGAIPIIAPLTPLGASLTAPQLVIWNAVNAAITGPAATITGTGLVRLPLWSELDDGAGNLKAVYNIGDNTHENDLARKYIGGIYSSMLRAHGLL